MDKKLICKENGMILANWQEQFHYAVLFRSIPISQKDRDCFDILAFTKSEREKFDRVLYAAKVCEYTGADIAFSELPLLIQKEVRSYYSIQERIIL